MFELETIRLIQKTFKRFLSLVMIVFIGAGFMMGLMSTSDIMKQSVDVYFDDTDMMDIQLYSSYGFSKDDYVAIENLDYVGGVLASKSVDVYVQDVRDQTSIVRVGELYRQVCGFELIEGRLPVKQDECLMLVDYDFHRFSIGDRISLNRGDEDMSEYLKNDEFTVVGIFRSPDQFSVIMGPSNLNNENLTSAMLVPNSNFVTDYYTTIYLNFDGSKDYISFTKDYENYINEKKTELDNFVRVQQDKRREQLMIEAQKELDEKTEMLEELKTTGQSKLDDAKKQLDEAKVTIASYEAQLSTLQATINSLQATMNQNKPAIEYIYTETEKLEDGISDFLGLFGLEGHLGYGTAFMDYAAQSYDNAISQFNSVRAQLNSGKAAYESGLKQYEEAQKTFDEQITEGERQLKLAQQQIDELPEAKWLVLDRSKHYSSLMFSNNVNQMRNIGLYLPILLFLVAALVCLTTMKRLVDEQRGQIGIFVALGFNKKQIILKYVVYALIASLIGAILGVIIGQLLFPRVIYSAWKLLYDLPPMKLTFPIKNVLLSVLSFCTLMCAVTAYVVYDTLKDVPASLMRPKAPKKAKQLLIEKISFLWNSFSFTSKITARNIFRYKARFLMTLIGVAGCTGLLVMGFGLKDSISDVLNLQYGKIYDYNYHIFTDGNENLEYNLNLLRSNPDNESISSYMSYMTRIYYEDNEDTANLMVMNANDEDIMFNLTSAITGKDIHLSQTGVIVSEKYAINHNLKIGDVLTIESPDGYKADVKIEDICVMYFQHFIFISDVLYEQIFDLKPVNNILTIKSDNKQALLRDSAQIKDFISFVDLASIVSTFETMIQALNLIIIVIILVAGALAFVVLMNLTQVNISERIREIATLKVLGFNDHEINMYIFKEILLLSFLGSLLGLPLGVIEHRFIMTVLNMEMIMFGKNVQPISFVYSIAITMVFTIIVLLFMRKPLRQVDMVESLKSVE